MQVILHMRINKITRYILMLKECPLSACLRYIGGVGLLLMLSTAALAHGVADSDQAFLSGGSGRMIACLLYTSPSPRD